MFTHRKDFLSYCATLTKNQNHKHINYYDSVRFFTSKSHDWAKNLRSKYFTTNVCEVSLDFCCSY